MASTSVQDAYKRARLLRRVMQVVFIGVFIATVLWAIPWLPYGLSVEDYNRRLSLLVFLGLGAIVSAFGAFYLRDLTHRFEQTLETWTSVHEGLGDLRRREYFFERVVMECQRVQAVGGTFTVLAFRLEGSDNDGSMTSAAIEAALPIVRDNDRLAALGAREIGVLAAGVDAEAAPQLAVRLKFAITKAIGATDGSAVSTGWATYETDALEAGSLVGIARARLQGRDGTADPAVTAVA